MNFGLIKKHSTDTEEKLEKSDTLVKPNSHEDSFVIKLYYQLGGKPIEDRSELSAMRDLRIIDIIELAKEK